MVKITKIAGSPKIDLKAHKLFMEAKHRQELEALAELHLLWNEFKEKPYGKRYEMVLTNELYYACWQPGQYNQAYSWAHVHAKVERVEGAAETIKEKE